MTAFHPVCIILTGLGSRGLSRRPGIVRPGKGIRIAVHCRLHQKPHLSGSIRRQCQPPTLPVQLGAGFSIRCPALHQSCHRQRAIPGNGTGHHADLQRGGGQLPLTKGEICKLRRNRKLTSSLYLSRSRYQGGAEDGLPAEAQGGYCFQHLLHRQLLHQGNKIGVAGIGGGIDHILNTVAAMPMTAKYLTIDLGHAGTLIAVARRNTILDRRSSNGELENRANAVCVQRTVYKRGTF